MVNSPPVADSSRLAGWIIWPVAALVCWFALGRVVRFDTPVDAALPWIGVALLVVAASTRGVIANAIPLLAVVEVLFVDERIRFLALGLIVAAAFTAAAFSEERPGALRSTILTIASIVILRWIPIADVSVVRELLLLLLAALTTAVLGGGPFAIAVAVSGALFTPLVPLRTLLLPLLLLVISGTARLFGAPRVRLVALPSLALGALLIFFPWSGVVARALPWIVDGLPRPSQRIEVNAALPAARWIDLDVPEHAVALIVSGANVPRMRRGAELGTLEPGHRKIRVGDVADWGALRRQHFYASSNPLPRDPAGRVRDYGYSAWIDGAGRIELPAGARRIRVTAASSLPHDASLQVEGFEVRAP